MHKIIAFVLTIVSTEMMLGCTKPRTLEFLRTDRIQARIDERDREWESLSKKIEEQLDLMQRSIKRLGEAKRSGCMSRELVIEMLESIAQNLEKSSEIKAERSELEKRNEVDRARLLKIFEYKSDIACGGIIIFIALVLWWAIYKSSAQKTPSSAIISLQIVPLVAASAQTA